MSSSDLTDEQRIDLLDVLVDCVLQDREDGRELLCEVNPDKWEQTVERPVDEVTFQPAEKPKDQDLPEEHDALDVEERVKQEIDDYMSDLGIDVDNVG